MKEAASKTVSVAAIENGTVIDHIACGQALRLVQLLGLCDKKHKVTIGLNLPSKRMRLKDLIKIENHVLAKNQADEITIFAPLASINIIKQYEVVEKINASLPEGISKVFICPNPACITNVEPMQTYFKLEEQGGTVHLICQYCEKLFDRNDVKVKI